MTNGSRRARDGQSPPRAFGERVVGAFVGGFFGLLLGAVMWVALYLVDPSGGLGFRVLLATVAYSALFTFIFGESLGDVLTMFFHLFSVWQSVSVDDREVHPDASWLRPLGMFLLFMVPYVVVVYLVVR